MAQIRIQFALDQIVHANLDHFVTPYQERGVSKAAIYAKLLMLGIQVALDLDLDLTDEVAVGRTWMETLKIDSEDDRKADFIEAIQRDKEIRQINGRDELPW